MDIMRKYLWEQREEDDGEEYVSKLKEIVILKESTYEKKIKDTQMIVT